MSNKIISIKNFTKKFKNFVSINDISFDVELGSIHGFVGPNGSGKTTTIKSLIGAYTYQRGSLKINNYDAGTKEANSLIGYVPEKASFPTNISLYEYLKWMGKLSNIETNRLKNKIDYYLKKLNLWELKNKKPSLFSSGMQKKVMIIQAVLNDPKLLIMDEPTANLDPTTRDEIIKLIKEFNKNGMTIFISSHILSELNEIVDSITFLNYGKILFTGKIKTLFDMYGNEIYLKVDDLILSKNILIENGYNEKNFSFLKNEIVLKNVSLKERNNIIKILINNSIKIETINQTNIQHIYNKLNSNIS